MAKKDSRIFNTIRNTGVNAICQIANLAVSIIVPRLLISTYGSVVNGVISTIKQIISYISLVGAGISESTIVSLYEPILLHDRKKVSQIYNAVGKTFNRAGLIFSTLALALSFVLPLLKNDGLPYYFIMLMVVILSISGASEFFVVGKYRALLTADQRIYVVNIAQTLGTVIGAVLTIILIKLKVDILIVQLIASITYVLRILLLYKYVRREYCFLDKKEPPDYTAISRRGAATVHQIASLIIFGSQALFIAFECGYAEESVYSVYNMIFAGVNTLLATVSSAVLGSMGNLMAENNNEKVIRVFDSYEFIYNIFAFSCYATALIMITPFLSLYVGDVSDAHYIRTELVALFVVMGVMNCVRTPGGTIINAKGHYKETQYRALLEMSICLVGQFALVKKMGIVGVLVATILAYFYRTTDVIIYSHHKIMNDSAKRSFLRFSVNSIALIACYFFRGIVRININGYIAWTICATLVMLVSLVVFATINICLTYNTWKKCLNYFYRAREK
jgi:O-antigen/teichoic acid export membrane protein